MQKKGVVSTVFLAATLVAFACSTSSSGPAGESGGSTPNSGGAAATGGSAGGGNTTPGLGGNNPGGSTQPGAGGSTGGSKTGAATGGSQPNAGGNTQPNAGGNTQPGAGGSTQPGAGGTSKPGAGGSTQPGAGGSTGGNKTGPVTGGSATGGVAAGGGQTTPTTGGAATGGQAGSNAGGSGAGGFTPPPLQGGSIAPAAGEGDFSMDPSWLFIKQDVTGAQATAFDDSKWSPVSTPHTWNDTDSYRTLINHSSGDTGTYKGPGWYRKHFKIPSTYQNNKVIIEFERIRHSASFYVNGTAVGTYQDGITPCGIDVTGKVTFGDTENVLAVRVVTGDSGSDYWEANATNPTYGGLVGHVWLHLPGKVYQTYPLFNNLQTSGIYIYGTDYASITNNTPKGDTGNLTLNVEAEVNNESGSAASATLGVKVVDPVDGSTLGTFSGTASSLSATGATTLKATGPLTGAKLWSDLYPNLYNVVTTLTVGGSVVNSRVTLTGFRKSELKGGAGTGGLWLNGRFVFLLGFAQRSTNEWAGLGEAVPDWMHDFHANLIRGANSNYIRWMHVAPQKADIISGDKYGVVSVAPAGDKEVTDPTDAQWQLRMAVMKAEMIYLRNNPSVIFWEAGNSPVSAAQMQSLAALMKQEDPNGGRGVGDRDMEDSGGMASADWFGTMIAYQPPQSDGSGYFRGYSDAYRDKGPIIECEDFRDEAMRGIWDDYSPPHVGGFKPGPLDTYSWQSESFTTAQVPRIDAWVNLENIHNTTAANSRYSAYGSIYFSDSDADGREMSSCVCRVSGKVDAVRLPKEVYYSFRVAGNTQPDIHIVGHWTYPAGTKKTMYVLANTPSVELFVNGTSQGKSSKPTSTYLFSFPSIAWATGTVKAVGYDASGKQVCEHTLTTAGAATAVKLTATVGPNGLQANGYDVAMFDVEIVDANGQRVPAQPSGATSEPKVTFAVTGPGTWRGGVNEGMLGSTNNLYLYTEGGINRVFIRSQTTAGDITLTADSPGLTQGKVTVTSKAVNVVNGLL